MQWSLKDTLLEQSEESEKLLYIILDAYEGAMSFDNNKTVKHHINTFNRINKDNHTFIQYLYSKINELDLGLASLSVTMKIVGKKIINLSQDNYLGLGKSKLMNLLNLCSDINTDNLVTKEEIFKLSKIIDSQFKPQSVEYRLLRLLCVSKSVGIVSTSCYIANLLLLQESIL